MLNNLPPVTKNLLLINIALFILTIIFMGNGGFDLSQYLSSHYVGTTLFEPYQIVTHMFMHSNADIMHIFFNMFLLVIFGSHLERVWGPKHFFIFYISCGIGAFALDNIVHGMEVFRYKSELIQAGVNIDAIDLFIERSFGMGRVEIINSLSQMAPSAQAMDSASGYFILSRTSGVGASGAIFGLLAAFAILFANTELYLMFIPIPIKAKYLIGVYVLYEIYQVINPVNGDNTNHWAHLGGALVGTIIVLVRRKTNKTNFY
ncbi:MAG: rhomboid family intramembrane serine protease [Crocinitomicaceae bacterium]|nr:rhomboid family intramembrane serine protease [Crocinitomicaceae bacterium]